MPERTGDVHPKPAPQDRKEAMRNFSVDIVGAGELDQLRQINALFANAFDDQERYAAAPPSDRHLVRLLASPHFIAVAASVEQRVVGALVAYELVKLEREVSEIYIYDVAVAEGFRRLKVATSMLNFLQRLASGRAAEIIYVQTEVGEEAARALYDTFGTRSDVWHFEIQPLERP